MARVPETIIDEIQSRSDIVEIISEYLPLKPTGKNYKAPCPFHQEKTPSFVVSPEKQIFNCFGCGVGGNVFSFLMKHEQLTFPEVLEMLAQKAGIELPQNGSRNNNEEQKNSKLFELNEFACQFFGKCLESEQGKEALKYLKQRGISEEVIHDFKLGYAFPSWDGLLKAAGKKGFSSKLLLEVGLILKRQAKEGFYDRFRGRIIFPILNVTGKVIGFGGRVMDDSLPKYMNSPETPLYHKSSSLYGLNLTKKHILREKKAIIVEGYLDVLIPFQAGINNIVASLGTALGKEHLRCLRRYTKEVIIVYDSDKAGIAATLRGLDLLLEEGLRVRMVSLPAHQDPDSFIQKYGGEKFKEKLEQAPGFFDYKMDLLLSRYDIDSVEGKTKIAQEIIPTIDKIQDAIEKKVYIKELATRINLRGKVTLGEEEIYTELQKLKKQAKNLSVSAALPREEGAILAERYLVQSLLMEGKLVKKAKELIKTEDFQEKKYQRIIGALFKLETSGKSFQIGEFISYLEDEELGDLVAGLVLKKNPYTSPEQAFTECLKRINEEKKKRTLKGIERKITKAQSEGEEELIKDLQMKYQALLTNI